MSGFRITWSGQGRGGVKHTDFPVRFSFTSLSWTQESAFVAVVLRLGDKCAFWLLLETLP